ncbi:hypothetical protein AB0H92_32050 [Streptomyces phaeochromogenes]|uniref:hypothetical protein n=1 Tax=Streptomyces phaeochromogenes TaxID=1923 RepID=UPI0033DE3185
MLRLPNVIGVGASRKVVSGRRTDTIGIVVYVTRKEPSANLAAQHRVPPELTVNNESVPTDVVEIAQPRMCALDDGKYRPIRGGCQIQSVAGLGTAGGVFFDRRAPHDAVLLTNNHVLTLPAHPDSLPGNRHVWQPGGGHAEFVGDSTRVVPMLPGPLGANYAFDSVVDAGIVEVGPGIGKWFRVIDIAGKHPFVALPPYEGLEVVRRGFRSQLKTGTVEAVGVTVITEGPPPDRKRCKIGGGGTVFAIRSPEGQISGMSGDSGSLVVDAAGQATRGLVFASDSHDHLTGGLTWACDMLDVMSAIEIETICARSNRLVVTAAVMKEIASSIAERERLIEEHVRKFARFRASYLSPNGDSRLSGGLGALLEEESGQEIAEALLTDDDFAGLLNRAIGSWLVQPTAFEMLEYRLPENFVPDLLAAFTRLSRIKAGAVDTDWLADVFQNADGRSMREVLDRKVRVPEPAVSVDLQR